MPEVGARTVSPDRPRLWVETLWLLGSLTSEQPVREISFERGLNLVVSPPASGSSGHGVGKTAFCQVLRFILDDPLWSEGSNLRDELLFCAELKEGGVAARVHVGGEAWTVLKPWQHQKHYRASRNADWRRLAANATENEFEAYQAALQQHLVGILPVQELPGSKQPIQWHHLLAWCSRDQNARYQNYFQWRAEGVGFSLPAKSPVALLRIVLGLLKDATALRDLDSASKEVSELEARLQALSEEPQYLLTHARRQLSRLLDVSDAVPFRQDGLIDHPNLIAIARQRHDAYQEELQSIDAERLRRATEREALIEKRFPLKRSIELVNNEIEQLEAFNAGDLDRVDELQKEASSLQQRLATWCDAGHLLLKDCRHVNERIELDQIDRAQSIKRHHEAQRLRERRLVDLRGRRELLSAETAPYDNQLTTIESRIGDLDRRHAETVSRHELLRGAIDDYENYGAVIAGSSPWIELVNAQQRLQEGRHRLEVLRGKHEAERGAMGARRHSLGETMNVVANALPGFTWGVFNDDEKHQNRPFRMGPMHSTTFSVLEILAGDIACLLDTTSAQSFHPGFLLHDSPREAEMSEAMLWRLLGHVASNSAGAFQYIVTTSTEPAPDFKPLVRLTLSADSEDGLLFRRRFGALQQELV